MIYKTVSGDMFDFIAYKIFGDFRFTGELMKANRHLLDKIIFSAGEEIFIPAVKEKKKLKLPPWKS